jgi:hypothetical protein
MSSLGFSWFYFSICAIKSESTKAWENKEGSFWYEIEKEANK